MASEWAVVAAGIGGGAVPSLIDWLRDRGRRIADKEIRDERALAEEATLKRRLVVDVIDAVSIRRESNLGNMSLSELAKLDSALRAAMLRLALDGQPRYAQHARLYLRDPASMRMDEWVDQLVAMVAKLDPLTTPVVGE